MKSESDLGPEPESVPMATLARVGLGVAMVYVMTVLIVLLSR